jgi:hypothetical protein
MTLTFLCGRGGCQVLGFPQSKHCPFEWSKTVTRYGSKQDFYIVAAPCTGKPLANGWCMIHQYVQEFLDLGARLGYPRLQINEFLWIGAGKENWEYYALVYPRKRREQVMMAVLKVEETYAKALY